MSASESFNLTPITASELPQEATLTMWQRSDRYTDSPRLIPSEFTHLFKITSGDDWLTYAGEHTKVLQESHIESNTYFVDMDTEGNELGIGDLRRVLQTNNDLYTPGSFVGWISTETEHQGCGLGRRRLLVMNLISLLLHKEPLKSGGLVSVEARALWKHLVADGLAKIDTSHKNKDTRYEFIN